MGDGVAVRNLRTEQRDIKPTRHSTTPIQKRPARAFAIHSELSAIIVVERWS